MLCDCVEPIGETISLLQHLCRPWSSFRHTDILMDFESIHGDPIGISIHLRGFARGKSFYREAFPLANTGISVLERQQGNLPILRGQQPERARVSFHERRTYICLQMRRGDEDFDLWPFSLKCIRENSLHSLESSLNSLVQLPRHESFEVCISLIKSACYYAEEDSKALRNILDSIDQSIDVDACTVRARDVNLAYTSTGRIHLIGASPGSHDV